MVSSRTLSIAALSLVACKQAPAQGPGQRSPGPESTEGVIRVETVAEGLVNPWGLEFLPDGRFLVTERPGRLRIIERNGTLSAPIAGLPDVAARGQGGLLDVTLDPGFARNRVIYISLSEPGEGGAAGTSVLRARDNRKPRDYRDRGAGFKAGGAATPGRGGRPLAKRTA